MTIPIMYQGRQQDLNVPDPESFQDPQQLYKYGHAPMYGGIYGGKDIIKPPDMQWRRRRLNLVAIFICLFVPWLLFCFMYWLFSFSLFFRSPATCYIIAFLLLAFVLWVGMKAYQAIKGSREGETLYEPTWYVFLFLTSLLAWCLAAYFGFRTFSSGMEPYYGLQNLGNYANVDPGKTPGQQLMDGGRVVFQSGSHLDLAKSMSFRNTELYCVTPIVNANYTLAGAPPSYDYWAVGVDCCCGDTVRAANFQCGEFKNPQATAGLRLMRDEQRPFYRLAVEQAVSTYGIRAEHPLFFHWVQDPVAATEAYRWEGHRQYLIGVYLHFALQLFLVCLAACCFVRSWEDK